MAELSDEDIILANKISIRIKYLREKYCGPKQADFVKKHSIDKQLISRWENPIKTDPKSGKKTGRGISIYSVNQFCSIIEISLKDFFDDEIFK
ncbi:hypothetical protein GCM10007103_12830 [Salinimicrobium marinum]|uniref:Uncharacterized protein n=1 Tax=Salinimicrobium marinum TaxID=680283 RepID=A0A918VXH2_9FLAO|nr:XRE family transcriptional regulator [Salinimicrobium marinum]GHA32817.1 hypothetical protein GCM10007103_12830 [Salinimicrobium marinum]